MTEQFLSQPENPNNNAPEPAAEPLGIPPPADTEQAAQRGDTKSPEIPQQQVNLPELAKSQWDRTRIHPLFSLVEQDAHLFGRRVIGGIQHLENRVMTRKALKESSEPNSKIRVVYHLPDGRMRSLDQSEIQEARRKIQPKDLSENKEEAYLRGLEDALALIKDHISGERKFGKAEKGKSHEGESDITK